MKKKKVLIIGAGVEQIEAVKIAKEAGLFVIVSDINPKAPAIPIADEFHIASTNDHRENLRIAKEAKIDGVCTVCSETAVPTVAFVAHELGLPSFSVETAATATDKKLMRKVFSTENVPVSKYIISNSLSELATFIQGNKGPWIVKPVDSSGQRGMTKINSESELEKAFQNAQARSRSKMVLLDQFIEGPEFHVTMWVTNQKVHVLTVSNRLTLDHPHDGIAVMHIGPSILPKQQSDDLEQTCIKAIKAIGLKNGVATCEVIMSDGVPFVMEAAIRVPGGYLKDIAYHVSGVDIIKSTVLHSVNELNDTVYQKKTKRVAAVASFITSKNIPQELTEIRSITSDPQTQINDHSSIMIWHEETPFKIPVLESSVGRFGVVISTGDTQKDAIAKNRKHLESIIINGSYKLLLDSTLSPWSQNALNQYT